MDALGGQINAYTTKEYTCYHTRVLDKHIDRALDVMSDMLLHPLIAQEEVQKERNVITEEIYMYDDAPEELVHDALQDAIWRDTSLGMPILRMLSGQSGKSKADMHLLNVLFLLHAGNLIRRMGIMLHKERFPFPSAQLFIQLPKHFLLLEISCHRKHDIFLMIIPFIFPRFPTSVWQRLRTFWLLAIRFP